MSSRGEVERFECGPRRRRVSIAACFADYRVGRAPCAGCSVGATHATLTPAERWDNGDRVMWIGELPVELEQRREDELRQNHGSPVRLSFDRPAEAAVIAEARTEPRERPTLRVIRGGQEVVPEQTSTSDLDGWLELAAQQEPKRREQPMAKTSYTYNGKTLTITEWIDEPEAKAIGLKRSTLDMRLRHGMSIEEALTTPLQARPGRTLTQANDDEQLDDVAKRHAKPKRAKVERNPKPHNVPQNGHVAPAAAPPMSTAAAVLELAGFKVREQIVPSGVMLFVEEPRA